MAYHHNQLTNHHHQQQQQQLPLQHFSDQPLEDVAENASVVIRSVLPDLRHQLAGESTENQNQPPPPLGGGGAGPTWLSNAILRQQSQYGDANFLNLHTAASGSVASQVSQQWLSRSILQKNDGVPASADSMIATAAAVPPESADANNNRNSDTAAAIVGRRRSEVNDSGGADEEGDQGRGGGGGVVNWQNAKYKADILSHPLYVQLLSAHVACLRIATPVDQLPRIDAQLAQSQNVVAKYSALAPRDQSLIADDGNADSKELDQFMVSTLSSFT